MQILTFTIYNEPWFFYSIPSCSIPFQLKRNTGHEPLIWFYDRWYIKTYILKNTALESHVPHEI